MFDYILKFNFNATTFKIFHTNFMTKIVKLLQFTYTYVNG